MHLVPLHSVLRSLAFHCFLGGGGSCRRQGKSAAPLGAGRGTMVGLIRVLAASFGHDEVKRARGARVRSRPIYQPPRTRARPAREVLQKWGVPGLGASGAVFVVCRPSSRSPSRADGWHGGLQGGRARFVSRW